MDKNVALFSFRHHKLSQKGIFPDKATLFDQLKERDVMPIISFGGEGAFEGGSVEAVDVAYARDGDGQEGYHIIELNGRAPYFVGFDKHPGVATKVRGLFADAVRQTIESGNA